MTTFTINQDFLLESGLACDLYHSYAEPCPIIDFHNHLPIKDFCKDSTSPDIGTLWVCSDPYKHRAMRILGVDERLISGDGATREKFDAWCAVFLNTIGNPLFHWSILELNRFFGITLVPTIDNAQIIWDQCNSLLEKGEITPASILKKVGVTYATTSDDLFDDVSIHKVATEHSGILFSPSLRADSLIAVGRNAFEDVVLKTGSSDLDSYLAFISRRLDEFDRFGCKLSDHALDNGFCYIDTPENKAKELFINRESLDSKEIVMLKSFLLHWLGQQYSKRGWAMQLHIGAERYTCSRLRAAAGAAGGYATIGTCCDIRSLCNFLDGLDSVGALPKTILYTLNPSDSEALATLTGSFSESGVQKIKFGPAWWYNDHLHGIVDYLDILSSYSLLSTAIGMTTDSRNVLSFSRHEYFRRILCNYLADKALRGHIPNDSELLGHMVENICWRNAFEWIYKQ